MAFKDTLEQLKGFDVNNIDVEKIGVWPLPAKMMVIMLLSVLVFFLTYYVWIRDLNVSLASEQAKEITLKETYKTKSFEAANLESYRAQMLEMDSTFKSLLSRLPSKTEIPGLLEDISARGTESGLSINGVTIDQEKIAEYYIEVPIKIDVDGGYHDVGGFVSGVAGMPRIVTLHDYTITKKKDSNVLTMQISAKTYRYKTTEQE